MEKYEQIKAKDLDWYYLGEENGIHKILAKNVLDEERIKKYADDDFMINGHDVRHQDTIRPFDWDKSYIKNVILPAFKKDLGIDCKVDLLTIEEVRELPDEIKKCDDWYWTKSRYTDYKDVAYRVNSSGNVSYGYIYSMNAVRPVLYLNSTQFYDEFIGKESYSQKIANLEKCTSKKGEDLCEKINEIIDILKLQNEEGKEENVQEERES